METEQETRTVLSHEQIKILEIEYERNPFITIGRQKQIAEEFNVDIIVIRRWFLERRSNDQYQVREKTELGPNSINLNENASSSSSLFTTATPVAGLQSVDSSPTSYFPSHHYMTFPSLDGVGPTNVTSQGNSLRSGQAAVADTTPTSSQQNTTIQPQYSNQQRVLRKKEVQHRPHYSDFENRKSLILWHLNSFIQRNL
ncbi:uncharacterized protein LOC143458691 [Clavelina lepadiformis]|uniref:uncharacterized protein LOC143458691 n=1 Tax=Clavelina lepadiformis TaxID=159417 RepID=UPI0040418E4F